MAEFYDTDLGIRFSVPDKPTVLQVLLYDGALGVSAGNDLFVRLWTAAKTLITDWQCEAIPDYNALDLNTADDMQLVDIVQFVGLATRAHVYGLRHVEKN